MHHANGRASPLSVLELARQVAERIDSETLANVADPGPAPKIGSDALMHALGDASRITSPEAGPSSAHPCVDCGDEVGPTAMLCPSCEDARKVVRLDEVEPLRRRVARRDRTLADLAGRYCSACGFSCWAVTDRGDASCYGCRLLARGITPRCARCKQQEWRAESGRRVCRVCEAEKRAGLLATLPQASRSPEGPGSATPQKGGAA